MGTEYSIQSSGVHGDQEVVATKLERIVEVQPAEKSSSDVTQGTSKTSMGEDEVESHTTKLERTLEMQLVGEAFPDVATGTPKSGFGEQGVGQTDKQQNEADILSLPNEAKEALVLQENYQEGDTSTYIPEGVVDIMKGIRPASEVNAVHCCTGDTIEVVTVDHLPDLTSLEKNQCTGQGCELNVGGQPLEHNLAQEDLSSARQKIAASRESHTDNRKFVCFLLNAVDFLTTNLFEAHPAVNDLEAQHPSEFAAVTTPPSTAKALLEVAEQLQCGGGGVEKTSSVEEFAKAVSDEPVLEIAEAQVAGLDEERIPQKSTQAMQTELETAPVATQQEKAEMEDTALAQNQALSSSIPDFLESAEKLINALEEEGKLQMSLLPKKKKLFCCTVL